MTAANPHSKQPDTAADTDQPDYSRLSPAGQDTLAVAQELFSDFNPQPGILSDLPQITVDAAAIDQVCRLAKDAPGLSLQMLHCLSCVDYETTFQLVYFLHSLEPERTLVIKADVPYDNPRLPSVAAIWPAAEWYEREARDLFGVQFDGNPDAAPLLLYEGFDGFPGRKEFPFYEYREF